MKQFFTSTRTMAILFFVYALAMAIGTFVENDFGTPASKVLIYNAKWFEILQIWLVVLFVFNIKRYNLLRKEKLPLLIFHLSFVLILIGAGITRYISFEGNMPIPEGETSNTIISSDTFFHLLIDDGTGTPLKYDTKYMFSEFDEASTNGVFRQNFDGQYNYKDEILRIKSLDYIPFAQEEVVQDATGIDMLEVVTVGQQGRKSVFLQAGDLQEIGGTMFSFNNPTEGAVEIFTEGDSLILRSPFDAEYVQMQGQQMGVVTDSARLEQGRGKVQAGIVTELKTRVLYSINTAQIVIPNKSFKGYKTYVKGDKNSEEDKKELDRIKIEISKGDLRDTLFIKGGKGAKGFDQRLRFGNWNVAIGFGSKEIKTPFAIELRDFQLDRYPGSNNASSYASEITVIDEGKRMDKRIFMNNIMDYKGYRFFQASYFPNEQGTILSVNKDWWGTWITYIGYMMLFFGLTFTLFWKGTRFFKLNEMLKATKSKSATIGVFLLLGIGMQAQIDPSQKAIIPADSLVNQFQIDEAHETKFARLFVQHQGRIKPMSTFALELLRKVHKSSSFPADGTQKLSAIEWFLGMHLAKSEFGRTPMIQVGEKGGEKLAQEVNAQNGYTSVLNLFALGENDLPYYKLDAIYDVSFAKKAAEQSNYDKEIITLTERFEVVTGMIEERYLTIFPVQNDLNETWSSGYYYVANDSVESGTELRLNKPGIALWDKYKKALRKALETKDYSHADVALDSIVAYQKQWGANVLPSTTKTEWEIRYNEWSIFLYAMIAYAFLAGVLLLLSFTNLFYPKRFIEKIIRFFLGLVGLVFVAQLGGLILRWYISGHAPWSNGYEAIMFISWVGVFAGLALYRNRNAFVPTAGCIVAVIMMGFAHGGDLLDPQITPLVPVLKSYWLMIHVAIIASSYGFFSLSAILGFIALILICLKGTKGRNAFQTQLKEITLISEMSLTVGLLSLVIGTFLGGMWANESWGRYWSWDPKETWAFISVIVYAFVLHMRLVPGLRGKLAFNIAATWAIWSIVMTYFGVNYYLSGLHSYAAGDPIPIPAWIPATAVGMLLLSILAAYRNKKLSKSIE